MVNAALNDYNAYICTETQALALSVLDSVSDAVALEIDEINLNLKIEVNA